MSDLRQRFYIEDSPVRGEVVHLEETLQTILAQRDYAPAVQVLLGEMLSATALLASTLKLKAVLVYKFRLQVVSNGPWLNVITLVKCVPWRIMKRIHALMLPTAAVRY